MRSSTTHWGRRVRAADSARQASICVETLPHDEPAAIAPTDDLAAGRHWTHVVASAAYRRVRAAWHAWRQRPPAAEAALDWLLRSAPVGDHAAGVAACSGRFDPCPGLTAGVLATAVCYGELPLARRLADWLQSIQLEGGAFPDAGLRRASPINTAHAAQGLMAAASNCRDRQLAAGIDAMAARACGYLAASGQKRKRSARHESIPCGPPLVELMLVAPLEAGADRYAEPSWRATIERTRERTARSLDAHLWQAPLHVLLPGVEALIDLNERKLAQTLLEPVRHAQRRDGAVPALRGGAWVSSTGLAHLAAIWYRLDEPAVADQAMQWLRKRQEPSGGFMGSYGRGACYYPRREAAWACKYFLDASQRQVAAAFDRRDVGLPGSIDPLDGRLQAVAAWCATFADGDRVADVGCGRGRYLKVLAGRLTRLQFAGVDPAERLLKELPLGVERMGGNLLNLPIEDGAFDAAFSIEALEHCLAPQRGVAELCRVVRPGGRVMVIDKNVACQPLSHYEPWERWFEAGEMSTWLARHCDEVKCAAVPHARHDEPTGLFLCWTGRRR